MKLDSVKKIVNRVFLILCFIFIIKYFLQYKEELLFVTRLKTGDIVVLCFLMISIHIVSSLKWFSIFKHMNVTHISFKEWFKLLTLSRFLNLHFLQAGNLYRSVQLKKQYDLPYARSLSLITIFTWFNLNFSLIFSIFIIQGFDKPVLFHYPAITVLTILLVINILLPIIFKIFFKSIKEEKRETSWFYGRINVFLDDFTECSQDLKLIFHFLILSMITYSLLFSCIFVTFKSIGALTTISNVALFSNLMIINNLIMITPSNLGVTEVLFGALSDQVGNTIGVGIVVAGIFRIINYITTLLLSLIFTGFSFKTISQLKNKLED